MGIVDLPADFDRSRLREVRALIEAEIQQRSDGADYARAAIAGLRAWSDDLDARERAAPHDVGEFAWTGTFLASATTHVARATRLPGERRTRPLRTARRHLADLERAAPLRAFYSQPA